MPASVATSSRRRPGVRRTPVTRSPAAAGSTSSRRARRYSPSTFDLVTRHCKNRKAAQPGPVGPRMTGALVARAPSGASVAVMHRRCRADRKETMTSDNLPGGPYQVADIQLTRVGYGAMQLAGPGVFGPPKDHDAAIAVLRTAVDLGINHIDTADYYGPYVTNELIREALAPYPDGLHIVTKVGGPPRRAGRLAARPHPGRAARAGARQPAPPRARRARRGEPARRRGPGGRRAGLDRGAVRGAGRAAAAGPDPAPRAEHGQR